ncbi:uncharacterized protein ARMOST_20340 [Armillaria ostoyae]|uniref:Uncharacterized protein n=1 Tax=Armillaria ostoyae TaxID=47428 RepID=A0A284S730_ARMOS|nr:uncharacterized protein ARMOST_20340 [Armillaria ostoyae]
MHAIAFIERLGHQLDGAMVKYNMARAALLCLRGPGEWEDRLRVLTKADVTNIEGAVFTIDDGMEPDTMCYHKKKKKTAAQQVVGEGEGFRTVLWIWTMEGSFVGVEDKEMNTVVCVEWLKSRARMHRWCKELLMVKLEMRRTLLSLERNACDWEARHDGVEELEGDANLQEGQLVYAESQAATWRRLAVLFQAKWSQLWAAVSALQPLWTEDEAIEREAMEEAVEVDTDTTNARDAIDSL